jgi:hypothetical protein
MAATKNLVIDQGATFSANIQYLDNSKNPISLAGYDINSQMRRSYYSANAVSFTANITNASTGNINIALDSTQTANLIAGRYVYDVEANIGSTVLRIVEGIITVTPGVTR